MERNINRTRTAIILILYFITTIFIISLIQYPGITNPHTGVIAMTDFEANKPFQYRVLMPVIIRSIEIVTPGVIKEKIDAILYETSYSNLNANRSDLPDDEIKRLSRYGYRVSVFFVLNYFALFMFLICLRSLAMRFGLFSEKGSDLLPLGIMLIMPIFFNWSNFIYDFAHLFLFTAGLLALFRKYWTIYILIFSLAVLNKESAVMLTVVFALNYFRSLPRAKFINLVCFQAAIFAVIKLMLYIIFKDNPGGFVDWTLERNLYHLTHISNYFIFEPVGKGIFFPVYLSIPLPRGVNLVMIPLIILTVIYRWREKPLFLRKSTGYFIILFFPAMTMGYIDELRAYYDVLPIVYLLGVIGINDFFRKRNKKTIKI